MTTTVVCLAGVLFVVIVGVSTELISRLNSRRRSAESTLDPDFVAFERSLGGWAEPRRWEALELEAREKGWPEALTFGRDCGGCHVPDLTPGPYVHQGDYGSCFAKRPPLATKKDPP